MFTTVIIKSLNPIKSLSI